MLGQRLQHARCRLFPREKCLQTRAQLSGLLEGSRPIRNKSRKSPRPDRPIDLEVIRDSDYVKLCQLGDQLIQDFRETASVAQKHGYTCGDAFEADETKSLAARRHQEHRRLRQVLGNSVLSAAESTNSDIDRRIAGHFDQSLSQLVPSALRSASDHEYRSSVSRVIEMGERSRRYVQPFKRLILFATEYQALHSIRNIDWFS